jgi:hypothetical protein
MRYQKINIGIERRYHSRAPISGLALILCPENPVTSDKFQITLKPSEEVDESVYSGIGVRFNKISFRDRKTIATLVAAYQ